MLSSLRRALTILVVVALAGLLTATAWAATSATESETFHGCVNNRTGVLRVIDPEAGGACMTRRGPFQERPITWNQTGPAGPVGPAGPAGAAGPAGEPASGGAGISSLDDLSGLPCDVNSHEPGTVRIEYGARTGSGSPVGLLCQRGLPQLTVSFVPSAGYIPATPPCYHRPPTTTTGGEPVEPEPCPEPEPPRYPGGTITVEPSGTVCTIGEPCAPIAFAEGTQVTLTATPDAGSRLSTWNTPECSDTELTCTIMMGDRDRQIWPAFQIIP